MPCPCACRFSAIPSSHQQRRNPPEHSDCSKGLEYDVYGTFKFIDSDTAGVSCLDRQWVPLASLYQWLPNGEWKPAIVAYEEKLASEKEAAAQAAQTAGGAGGAKN